MRVLIVEDEALLALELESEIEIAGHHVVGQAASSVEAKDIAERERPDFAFVDISLVDGPTGIDVGRFLATRHIPFVFVSANIKRLPEDFAGALGAIEKPYTMHGLQNALAYLAKVIDGEAAVVAPPSIVMATRAA
ncbi:response regulator [Rhizobium sp. BK379]|uniref:response regulator n=1 Tax=Rhizobium sp. BK379 TaxID=2587059 RepID=UPI00160B8963|nr:response regulator [Rhizobium sp. BK379]